MKINKIDKSCSSCPNITTCFINHDIIDEFEIECLPLSLTLYSMYMIFRFLKKSQNVALIVFSLGHTPEP